MCNQMMPVSLVYLQGLLLYYSSSEYLGQTELQSVLLFIMNGLLEHTSSLSDTLRRCLTTITGECFLV
jgi:hypothetical protein